MKKNTLNDIFNLFDEFRFYKAEVYNWDKLKKEGNVTESSKEENGFLTITRTFVSHDGSKKITDVFSKPIIDSQSERLIDIEKEIQLALKQEDYEKCASLKKEREQIKLSQSKSNLKS